MQRIFDAYEGRARFLGETQASDPEVISKVTEKLTEIFRTHGLLESGNYEPIITGGYYGEELDGIRFLGNLRGVKEELKKTLEVIPL